MIVHFVGLGRSEAWLGCCSNGPRGNYQWHFYNSMQKHVEQIMCFVVCMLHIATGKHKLGVRSVLGTKHKSAHSVHGAQVAAHEASCKRAQCFSIVIFQESLRWPVSCTSRLWHAHMCPLYAPENWLDAPALQLHTALICMSHGITSAADWDDVVHDT